MTPETLFTLCTWSVLPAWVLLAVAPTWRWSQRLALVTSLLIAALYCVLVILFLGNAEGSMGSLQGVQLSFQSPWIVLIGWIHYLALDLFIGSWEARDAARVGLSRWALVPCLAATLLFAPAGVLLYMAVRTGRTRGFALQE